MSFEKSKISLAIIRRRCCHSLNILIPFYLVFSAEKSLRSETLKCSLTSDSRKSTLFFCYNVRLCVFRAYISAKDFGDGSGTAR